MLFILYLSDMKKTQYSYLLARLPIGMSFFIHGIERIPKLTEFATHMAKPFEKSPLPMSLVMPYGYVLPFFELLTGILILLGLFTRFATVLGIAIILTLIFGSGMIEKWDNVFTQIIYGAYLALLFHFADYNTVALDKLFHKTR
jgi:thiosulfate dehydrogenase (quinone) large subunit